MTPGDLALYKEIYACMHCSRAMSEKSVKSFVLQGPLQTLPVSHFGDIANAKIWLIGTNPKGRRADSNVGFRPSGFGSRTGISDEQVAETFEHFRGYFQRAAHDSYFDRWINTLDRLELGGTHHTFRNGGICCVDLIKCPTTDNWGNVVRGPDKLLIYGCFDLHRYFSQQVALHVPRVLIFSAGLGARRYYPDNCRANRDLDLRQVWPKELNDICSGVWSFSSPRQPSANVGQEIHRHLSIGLKSDSAVERAKPEEVRTAIQQVIRAWEQAGTAVPV